MTEETAGSRARAEAAYASSLPGLYLPRWFAYFANWVGASLFMGSVVLLSVRRQRWSPSIERSLALGVLLPGGTRFADAFSQDRALVSMLRLAAVQLAFFPGVAGCTLAQPDDTPLLPADPPGGD